jgi:4'-phosphopantetheinyl transferase
MAASAKDVWAPGPSRPRLAAGAVHVWRADLATADGSLAELLSIDERERSERILDEHQRELWTRSRGLLRELLGRYLEREPRSLRFAVGKYGKPEMVGAGADSPAFNMSHSGELALYAFSDAGAVGVDVEVARRPVDEVAIAARMLGEVEAQRLQALDPRTRRQEFLCSWARNEAELKCLGIGIGESAGGRAGPRPSVVALELGADVGAAVASEQPARILRFDVVVSTGLCRSAWSA